MSDPAMIEEIKAAVTIPVMAKARIGHFIEAQILDTLVRGHASASSIHIIRVKHRALQEIDFIDESEVLTPADEVNHIDKTQFNAPFVCGCRNLGEALRRISEGAAMLRTKGEAGTGNVVEAVRHLRTINGEIRKLQTMDSTELYAFAKNTQAPIDLIRDVQRLGRLPVVNFAAGGVATPADAALMMALGADGVFVGSGIFNSEEPSKRARAIVQAVSNWENPKVLLESSRNLGKPMSGIGNLNGAEVVSFRERGS